MNCRPFIQSWIFLGVVIFWSSNSIAQEIPLIDKFRKLEIQTPNGDNAQSLAVRKACYLYGKNLATLSVLQLKKFPDSDLKNLANKTKLLGDALKIDTTKIPATDGFKDFWNLRDSILGSEKDSIASQIGAKHSEDCEGLFRLSCELMFATTLYDSEGADNDLGKQQREFNQIMKRRFQIALVQSEFDDVVGSVRSIDIAVDWIENGYPSNQPFGRVVRECFDDIEDLLEKEDSLDEKTAMLYRNRFELKRILSKYVEGDEKRRRTLMQSWMPTEQASVQLFKGDFAKVVASEYKKLFNDPGMMFEPSPKQTNIVIEHVESDEISKQSKALLRFPGGYKRLAGKMKPGFTIFQVQFLEPGNELGYRVEGFVKIDDRWYCFPKAWRLVND